MSRQIADDDHFVRYCSPGRTDNGMPKEEAFRPRAKPGKPPERYLSGNWMEFFGIDDRDTALSEIRRTKKSITMSGNGKFVVLEFGRLMKSVFTRTGIDLQPIEAPKADDPSHCGLIGYDPELPEERVAIAQAIHAEVAEDDVYSVPPAQE